MATKQAFSGAMTSQIEASIDKLAKRQINMLATKLTIDDVIALFIKPEHVAPLVQVFELVNLSPAELFYTSHRGARLVLGLNYGKKDRKLLTPAYVGDGVLEEAPEEPLAKLNTWFEKRLRIGQEFAIAAAAFRALNRECTKAELVYFMPSICGILRMEAHTTQLADTLQHAPMPRNFPNLDPRLREAAQQAEITFAKSLLLEDKEARKEPVAIGWSQLPTLRTAWGDYANVY